MGERQISEVERRNLEASVHSLEETVRKLSDKNARKFLGDVQKFAERKAKHYLTVNGTPQGGRVMNILRREVPKLDVKEGELQPVSGLLKFYDSSASLLSQSLHRVSKELDIVVYGNRHGETGFSWFRPVSSEGHGPLRMRKPEIFPETYYRIRGLIHSGLTIQSLEKLGLLEVERTSDLFNKKIIRECWREIAEEIKRNGYSIGFTASATSGGYDSEERIVGYGLKRRYRVEKFSREENDGIFKGFLEKTGLPVATSEERTIFVYHPKIIRNVRDKAQRAI